MSNITKATRKESYKQLDSATVRGNIITIFQECQRPMSAADVATEMYKRRLIPYPVRQATAPRITELVQNGRLEPCGKAYDSHTERNVAVFRLVKP